MPFSIENEYVFYIRPDGVKQLHGPVVLAAELMGDSQLFEIRRFDMSKKNYQLTHELDGTKWHFDDGTSALVENGLCRKNIHISTESVPKTAAMLYENQLILMQALAELYESIEKEKEHD